MTKIFHPIEGDVSAPNLAHAFPGPDTISSQHIAPWHWAAAGNELAGAIASISTAALNLSVSEPIKTYR